MLAMTGPAWKRTGCLVWSPRTTETGTVPLLDFCDGDDNASASDAKTPVTEPHA